jgi:type I restriction enzyme S subunit
VDELMALCDQLEAAKTEREQSRDWLVAASLHRLNQPADAEEANTPEAFRDHARFIFDLLSRLTTRPEHIKQLRETILNLAVSGQLVPQDPNDEPVTHLLRRVDDERKQVAAGGEKRTDACSLDLLNDHLTWPIPTSWSIRALADLMLFIDYRGKTPAKVSSGVRLITAKNVRPGVINREPEEFVSEVTYRSWMTRGLPRVGDVLFTTEAPMGNAAVVSIAEQFALAQRTICFRLFAGFDPRFVALQINARPFQELLDFTATGLTAKGIKAAKLKHLPFAVPPLAEQHRIVAKVDELMVLCDHLEAQLATTEADSRRLLEAVLHEALAPTLEKTA